MLDHWPAGANVLCFGGHMMFGLIGGSFVEYFLGAVAGVLLIAGWFLFRHFWKRRQRLRGYDERQRVRRNTWGFE
jgi:hypothetical protein